MYTYIYDSWISTEWRGGTPWHLFFVMLKKNGVVAGFFGMCRAQLYFCFIARFEFL